MTGISVVEAAWTAGIIFGSVFVGACFVTHDWKGVALAFLLTAGMCGSIILVLFVVTSVIGGGA